MLKFSVVIPAYNESAMIDGAVAALLDQTVPRNEFEIIVVDNDSTDDTAEIARRAGADKVVLEDVKGTNIARQRGVINSGGEILAFLDADCRPNPNWLEMIGRLLSRPGVAGVSGPYDYGFPRIKQALAKWYFNYVFRYFDRILFIFFRRKAGIMMGGNFATRREYLDRIGGLPPIKFYGDDAATGIALSRKVGKVEFRPELIVRSSPRRMDQQGCLSLTVRYAWHFFKIYFHGPPSFDGGKSVNHSGSQTQIQQRASSSATIDGASRNREISASAR